MNNQKFSTQYEDPSNEYKKIAGNSFIEESAINNVSKIQSETGNFTNGRIVQLEDEGSQDQQTIYLSPFR